MSNHIKANRVIFMARDFSKSFYNSKEWKMVRESALRRDNYLCVVCGKPADEVHHIKHLSPDNIYDPSVSLNLENLQSLCRDCHFEAHRGEHASGRAAREEQPQYIFDENGLLIKTIE